MIVSFMEKQCCRYPSHFSCLLIASFPAHEPYIKAPIASRFVLSLIVPNEFALNFKSENVCVCNAPQMYVALV